MLTAHVSQVILVSATMPQDVLEVTDLFMRNPVRILVKKEEVTLEGIRQFYVDVQKEVGCILFSCVVTPNDENIGLNVVPHTTINL